MKLSLIEKTLKLYEQSQGYFSFLFSTPPIIKALQVLYKEFVNEFNNSSSNSTVRDPDLTKSQVQQLLFVLDRSPFAKDFYLQELIQTVHNELRHHIEPPVVKEPTTIVVKNQPAVSSNEIKQTDQKNKKTEQLETALLALKAAGILTEENRTACTITLGKRVRFVSVLQDAGLLNQKNFVVLVSDAAISYEFHDAFIYVQHAKLLTQTHFDMIAHEPISVMNKIICNSFAHRDLDIDFHNNENEANAFAWVLVHLRSRNMLTESMFDDLQHDVRFHPYRNTRLALWSLNISNLLDYKNLNALFDDKNQPYIRALAKILYRLHQAKIATQSNFNTVIHQVDHVWKFATGVITLARMNALTQGSFDVLTHYVNYKSPPIVQLLIRLKNQGLLTQENCHALIDSKKTIKEIVNALKHFDNKELTKSNVENVLNDFENQKQNVADAFMILTRKKPLTLADLNIIQAKRFHAQKLATGIIILSNDALLSEENYRTLNNAAYYAPKIATAMCILNKAHMLSPENRETILQSGEYAEIVARALVILQGSNILTQKNRNRLMQHSSYADKFARAFVSLHAVSLLSDENYAMVKTNHLAASEIAEIINVLHQNNLLTQANFNVLFANPQSGITILSATEILSNAKILTQDNFNAIIASVKCALTLSEALVSLNACELLSSDNLNKLIANVQHIKAINPMLSFMNHHSILAAFETFDAIIAQAPFIYNLSGLLNYPWDTILTRNNFYAFLSHARYFNPEIIYALQRIPRHLVTQETFNRLLANINQAEDIPSNQQRMLRFINRLLGIVNNQLQQNNVLNPTQSTHTNSVHKSVSESAIILKRRNPLNYSIIAHLTEEIQIWQTTFDTRDITAAAANRFLNKLLLEFSSITHYRDTTSNVNLKELLIMLWRALHDTTQLCVDVTIENGKAALIRGLYEAQREYNFNQVGVDDQSEEDRSACPPGAFNKLTEVMVGIIKDVQVDFITTATATLKLKAVVKDTIFKHLNPLPGTERLKWQEALKDKGEGLTDEMWQLIRPSIEDLIFNEFQNLYQNDKNHANFQGFIETGRYISILGEEFARYFLDSHASAPGATGFFSESSTSTNLSAQQSTVPNEVIACRRVL